MTPGSLVATMTSIEVLASTLYYKQNSAVCGMNEVLYMYRILIIYFHDVQHDVCTSFST